MTAVDFAFIALASPLVATLIYGTYRFYIDPDGEKSVVNIQRKPAR